MIKAVDLFAGLGGWRQRPAGRNSMGLIQPEPHNTRPGLRRAGDFCL